MKRDELPLATLDLRHAGELLAHPCSACDFGPPHSLGEHLWDSTRNMAPGPRAHNTDPTSRGWPTLTDDDAPDPVDRTASIHPQYIRLIQDAQNAALALKAFIDAHRPDRWTPLPEPLTDEDWCRNHLNAGLCYPRDRGDLCRWCYEIGLAHNVAPDPILIRAKERGRVTTNDIADFLARVKVSRKTRRKKAS